MGGIKAVLVARGEAVLAGGDLIPHGACSLARGIKGRVAHIEVRQPTRDSSAMALAMRPCQA
jgi:hypothetical protein